MFSVMALQRWKMISKVKNKNESVHNELGRTENCFRSNCEIDKQHLCMTEQLEELLSQLTWASHKV